MNFWNWYFQGIKNIFTFWRHVPNPWLEYIAACIFLVGCVLGLSVAFPWWLFLAIPVGITWVAHALWRIKKFCDC